MIPIDVDILDRGILQEVIQNYEYSFYYFNTTKWLHKFIFQFRQYKGSADF